MTTSVNFPNHFNIMTAHRAAKLAGYDVTGTLAQQNCLILRGHLNAAVAENDIATAGYLFC